ncbi:MAG: hypothetical protein LHW48_04085 [Candidatus Cloacimonetes bacterium]|nr:hypothetical protein [Candidatus Cloacimonadota bacterium]
MKTLVTQVDQADKGVGKGAENFKRLGINVRDASGNLKNQETLFNEVAVALQNMEDGSEKARIANELLGRSGSELMPLLNGAAGSIEEMKKQAQDLGLIISDEGVDAAVIWTDAVDQAKRAMGGLFNTLASSAMPHFNKGIQWLVDKMPSVRKFVVDTFESIRQAIENNAEKFDRVKAAIDEIKNKIFGAFSPDGEGGGAINWLLETGIPGVVDGIASVLSVATDVYNFISDNWSKFEPLIYGIVGALIAYKAIKMGIATWTGIVTAAQWAWNAALNANPIGLVVIGIAALIAVGTLLIRNWDNVKLAGQKTWNSILSGVEWMVNGVIKAFNWMVEQALKPLNKLIEGINKITGASIATVEFGIKTVDFSAAKYDVEDKEFDWRWKKEPGDSPDAIMAEVTAQQKKYELEQKQQATSQTQLVSALEENTEMLHSTRGGGNSFNITVVGTDLTAEEIADKLVPRIERKLFA